MSIRPVDFSGMIQRTTDVSNLKQNEDAKPVVDQQNSTAQMVKHEDAVSHQVLNSSGSAKMENHSDAKEEGRGQYFNTRGKKQSKKKEDVKVIVKNGAGVFDIKI